MRLELLAQIPPEEPIGRVTADGACDVRPCHAAIAAGRAKALVGRPIPRIGSSPTSHPSRRRGRPWKEVTSGARPASSASRATCRLGRSLCRSRSGIHGRSRAAADAGIVGSDIQDMMLEAVEARFGGFRATQLADVLTDNGSACTAKDKRIFARLLGLRPCFTPVRSPPSNGVPEAFVHTLMGDYVQVMPLPDARTVLGLIGAWFDEFNDHHLHSRLNMRSPREFIAAQAATH